MLKGLHFLLCNPFFRKIRERESAMNKDHTMVINGLRKKRLGIRIKQHWRLYVFLLVPVAYILIFKYLPMTGLLIAFKNYKVRAGIWGSEWVGFAKFIKFFQSYQFERVLKNTLILSAYSIAASIPFSIIFALLINCFRDGRTKKLVQAVVTLPYFISTAVMVGIILQIFNSQNGIYGMLFKALFGSSAPNILGSSTAFRHLYVWTGVWQGFGWDSIIYTAALAAVDPSLHEAAQLDGASRFKRVIHVDFPAIVPTIVIMLILRLGQVMNVGFEKVYLMQNSLNMETSQIISTYVYEVGLSGKGISDFSYATAIDMFNSVINLILIVTVNQISRKVSDTSLW